MICHFQNTPVFHFSSKIGGFSIWTFPWGISRLSPPILPTSRLKFQKWTSSAKRACYAISKTPPFFTLAQKLAILEFWAFQWGTSRLSPPISPTFRLKFPKQTSSAQRACYAISKTPPFFTLAQKLEILVFWGFSLRYQQAITLHFALF